MNLTGLLVLGIGGLFLYSYYWGQAAGLPGAGSGSGSAGSGSGSGGSGGTGSGVGAGSGSSSGGLSLDAKPLAAAGDPQWVALVDQSGLLLQWDEWAWYWNQVRESPLLGSEMDAILNGADRAGRISASAWRAAVDAAGIGATSAWET